MESGQGDFEGTHGVFDEAKAGEQLAESDERAERPVFAFDQGYSAVTLGGIREEPGLAFKTFSTYGEFDLWRLLDVADPVAIHVGGGKINVLAVGGKPDGDFVRLAGFPAVVRYAHGGFAGDASEFFGQKRVHHRSFLKAYARSRSCALGICGVGGASAR